MNIGIYPQQIAEIISGDIEESHIWISITSPECSAIMTENSNCRDILRLQFDDMEPMPEDDLNEYVLFNEEMASRIINFVDRHKDNIEAIYIHCEAGISRSAGTASAIAVWLNGEDKTTLEPIHHPNAWVKSLLMREIRKRI